ncbi:MAG: T9SS type A sorting domain-containing protein [Flavobacterium sp.]|nr:MAG: T9SS type A sorting domain-containing protein [Flavobacterium sp.]
MLSLIFKTLIVKKFYFLMACFAFLPLRAQIVNIPDANFKNALVNTLCVYDMSGETTDPIGDVDTNNDGEIQFSEAATVEWLKVDGQNIASLEGIEAFSGLMVLSCANNLLTAIEMPSNTNLIALDCSHNQITAINVSFPVSASDYEVNLNCSYNSLSDFTLPYTGVGWGQYVIDCSHNQLTNIIIPSGVSVYALNLNYNLFSTLDLTISSELIVSNCPNLTYCQLTADFVTVTNNAALTSMSCRSNGTYEVHNNPVLQSIDLKDGGVGMVIGDNSDPHYHFQNNPSLQFVCVDDLGHWYNEGNDFFMSETDLISVSPGVDITFYCDFTPGGGYNTINGSFHLDCAGSNTAINGQNLVVNLDQGSDGSVQATTNGDGSGNFTFYTAGGGTVSPVIQNNYFTITPASGNFSFPASGDSQTMDFCLTPNGTHFDLAVSLIPVVPARPGFDAKYRLQVQNQGTDVQSGMLTFNFDDNVSDFVSADPSVTSQSLNEVTWNFSGLAPFEVRTYDIILNTNSPVESPAVNSGDQLSFTASVLGATDETPADNTYTLFQTVVGSIDPNDKSVSKANIGLTELSDYLYYTIRFQNTGSFYAENVAIRDLLSDKLDLSSFQFMSSSHACRALLTPKNFGMESDKLEFFFESIELPATSDNEPASHGFVTFRIKPKSNLTIGDVISNSAGIYFDYNSAVETNTVTTTVTALGVNQFSEKRFSIYPNPAGNNVDVDLGEASAKIAIYNMLGQLVKSHPETAGAATLDISDLESGTYLVEVRTTTGKQTKKLIKL